MKLKTLIYNILIAVGITTGGMLWYNRTEPNIVLPQDIIALRGAITERCLATQIRAKDFRQYSGDAIEVVELIPTTNSGYFIYLADPVAPTNLIKTPLWEISTHIVGVYTQYSDAGIYRYAPPSSFGYLSSFNYMTNYIGGIYSNLTVSGFEDEWGWGFHDDLNGVYTLYDIVGDTFYYTNEFASELIYSKTYTYFQGSFFPVLKEWVPWIPSEADDGFAGPWTPTIVPSGLNTRRIIPFPLEQRAMLNGVQVVGNGLASYSTEMGYIDSTLFGNVLADATGTPTFLAYNNIWNPIGNVTNLSVEFTTPFYIANTNWGITQFTNRFDLRFSSSNLYDLVAFSNRTTIAEGYEYGLPSDLMMGFIPNTPGWTYTSHLHQITKDMLTKRYNFMSHLYITLPKSTGPGYSNLEWVPYDDTFVFFLRGVGTNYSEAVDNLVNALPDQIPGRPYSYSYISKDFAENTLIELKWRRCTLKMIGVAEEIESEFAFYAYTQPFTTEFLIEGSNSTYETWGEPLMNSNYFHFESIAKNFQTNAVGTVLIGGFPPEIPDDIPTNSAFSFGYVVTDEDVIGKWHFLYATNAIGF